MSHQTREFLSARKSGSSSSPTSSRSVPDASRTIRSTFSGMLLVVVDCMGGLYSGGRSRLPLVYPRMEGIMMCAAVPTNALAELPDGVSFEEAATLPVAGLTALYALDKGGNLLGKDVLITGASGGAGQFALQLGRMSGARVVALVRRPEHEGLAREAGAHQVAVDDNGATAEEYGPYHLILESVGGDVLGNVLPTLAPEGTCVSFGVSGGAEVTFDARELYLTGGAKLYGFILFHEVIARPAPAGLARLVKLVDEGLLKPSIEIEAPWTDVGEVASRLIDRGYTGKAVLRVS